MTSGTVVKILVRDLDGKVIKEWDGVMQVIPAIGDTVVLESHGEVYRLNRVYRFKVRDKIWCLDTGCIVIEAVPS